MNNISNTTEDVFLDIIKQKDAGATCDMLVAQYPVMKEDIAFLFDTEQSLKQAFAVEVPEKTKSLLDGQFLVTPDNEARHISVEGAEKPIPSPYQQIINRTQKTLAFGIPVLVLLVLVVHLGPTTVVSPTVEQVTDMPQVSDTRNIVMNRSSSEKVFAPIPLAYQSTESMTDASLVDSVIDGLYQDMDDDYSLSEDESMDASLVTSDADTIASYDTNFYDNTL